MMRTVLVAFGFLTGVSIRSVSGNRLEVVESSSTYLSIRYQLLAAACLQVRDDRLDLQQGCYGGKGSSQT